MSGVVQLKTRC